MMTDHITARDLMLSPLWLYAGLVMVFLLLPDLQAAVSVFVLVILGYPHFFATFPLAFHSEWRNYRINLFGTDYDGAYIFFWMPAIMIGSFIVLYLIAPSIASVLFLVVNFFHITRQSEGLLKVLSGKDNADCVGIGIFYLRLVNYLVLTYLIANTFNVDIGTSWFPLTWVYVTVACCMHFFYRARSLRLLLNWIVGAVIYSPFLFTDNILAIITLGTSMHYLQYLFLASKVLKGRSFESSDRGRVNWLWIFCGAFCFSFLSWYLSFYLNVEYSTVVVIPLAFQLYHFIVDAFLWRGSVEVNRKMLLRWVNE